MEPTDQPATSNAPASNHTSFSSVCYQDISAFVNTSIGRNPRRTNSCWGAAAEALFQNNSATNRLFLSDFTKICKAHIVKYKSTTTAQMLQAIKEIPNISLLSKSTKDSSSLWGVISRKLFLTSTANDMSFVSNLWNLYMKYSSDQQHNLENEPCSGQPETQYRTQIPQDLSGSFQQTTNRERKNNRLEYLRQYYREHCLDKTPEILTENQGPISDLEAELLVRSQMPNLTIASEQTPRPGSPIHSDNDTEPSESFPSSAIIQDLTQAFHNSIWQFPTQACETCNKLIYKSKSCNFTVNERSEESFRELGVEMPIGTKLKVCERCRDNMKRGSLSPQVKYNNLDLPPVPPEIECLSQAEVRLISQVKLYMKVFHLSNGRGQPALKGLAVHFPLKITEVIQQLKLPMNIADSDTVIVSEDFTGLERVTEFMVRPAKVQAALEWLKINNPLYSNIEIVPMQYLEISSICLHQTGPRKNPVIQIPSDGGYITMQNQASILRSSIHQGHPMFGENRGKQCTAMAASFLAFSFVQSPLTWTKVTLDQVMLCGNSHYSNKRQTAGGNHLTVDEVCGVVSGIFGSVSVQINMELDELFQLQGFLNRYPVRGEHIKLQQAVQRFIDMPYQFAILTCSSYSMALFQDDDFLFFYDSHSRGLNGGVASKGTGCVIRYSLAEAPTKLSYLINHNIQPKISAASILQQQELFQFTITPISCTYDEAIPPDHERDEESSSPASPTTKRRRSEDLNAIIDDLVRPERENVILRVEIESDTLNGAEVTDCVIDSIDFIEPPAEDVINLHRTAGRPLNSVTNKSLDLLAFPNLFPHGVNGINHARKIRITPPDYFQQRLMSADKRFAGNTELLFYALAESDKFRVQQKIAVCCLQKNQEGNAHQNGDLPPGGSDPSSYMSAIRGSASYWKKYCGDLIAMITQLGIPTFFLTFSFDDLNSKDAVTALWKAEHGEDSEPPPGLSFDDRKNLLNKYPIAAARHFSMRVSKFIQLIKSNSLQVFGKEWQDYSVRIEFQSRGSPHAHCLIWLKDVPSFKTAEGILFIDRNVSCSLQAESKDLVLKYQQHKCTPTCYKNNPRKCRFAFPRKSSEETKVIEEGDIDENGGRFVNLKRRPEEAMVNNYHPILLYLLRCNMDIQPVTGEMAIAFYIAKYMAKAEPADIRLQIQQSIETIMKSSLTAQQKMNRVALTLMKNREVSAQEAAFRLCHLFLKKSSRVCVFVPAFQKQNRRRMIRKETIGQDPKFCLNVIDRYMSRPTSLDQLCLLEFAAHYEPYVDRRKKEISNADEDVEEFQEDEIVPRENFRDFLLLQDGRGKIRRRTIPAVVKYPNFDIDKDMDSYYYCLILMYLPFREEDFCDEDTPINVFKTKHVMFRKHSDDPILDIELAQRIDRALLRVQEYSFEDQQNPDEAFGPSYAEAPEPPLTIDELFAAPTPNCREQVTGMFATLSDEQKAVFLKIDRALKEGSRGLKLAVCGEGGTGKSYLIRLLTLLITTFHDRQSLIIAAPTGKAAFNVQGSTLHRTFLLPVEIGRMGVYHQLGGEKLEEMTRLFKNVKFIFIDEFSMMSYEVLRMIHRRLTEIFRNEEAFGDINIVLYGDLMQLKPPRASWIFKLPNQFRGEVHLWRMFEYFELTINHRQIQLDPLIPICSNLRIGKLELSQIEQLKERLLDPSMPNYPALLENFKNCIWAYPKLKQCDDYNTLRTEDLKANGVTIYKIRANDTYADGLRFGEPVAQDMVPVDPAKCGSLEYELNLGIGSRVMLRRNIGDVRKGLVNGAMGTVQGFEWCFGYQHDRDEGSLPLFVLIKFDHLDQVQKIAPATSTFFGYRQKRVTRMQLPLIVAFAVNIHKMQGDSVDQLVLYLGKSLFAKAMAYVGVSRTRTMAGLAVLDLEPAKLYTTTSYCPCDLDALAELMELRKPVGQRYMHERLQFDPNPQQVQSQVIVLEDPEEDTGAGEQEEPYPN